MVGVCRVEQQTLHEELLPASSSASDSNLAPSGTAVEADADGWGSDGSEAESAANLREMFEGDSDSAEEELTHAPGSGFGESAQHLHQLLDAAVETQAKADQERLAKVSAVTDGASGPSADSEGVPLEQSVSFLLVMAQLMAWSATTVSTGFKWTKQFRGLFVLCLTLYICIGETSYSLLRGPGVLGKAGLFTTLAFNVFLPSPRHLRRYLPGLDPKSGTEFVTPKNLETLQAKWKALMGDAPMVGFIAFDGMFIVKGFFYSLRRFLLTGDGWIGRVTETTDAEVDFGAHVPQSELANEAFQLYFISLDGKVQIPIGHIFVHGIDATAVSSALFAGIVRLESAGFTVLGCVSDGEAAMKSVQDLLAALMTAGDRAGAVWCNFMDYDHLLKCLRNVLLNRELVNEGHYFSVDVIRCLHASSNADVKALFAHLVEQDLNPKDKQNTQRALNICSRRTIDALKVVEAMIAANIEIGAAKYRGKTLQQGQIVEMRYYLELVTACDEEFRSSGTLAKLLAAYQKLDSYLDQALQDIQDKVEGDPATVAANLLSHQSRESVKRNVAAISELMRAIAGNPALAAFEPKLLLKYITTNRVENGFSAHRMKNRSETGYDYTIEQDRIGMVMALQCDGAFVLPRRRSASYADLTDSTRTPYSLVMRPSTSRLIASARAVTDADESAQQLRYRTLAEPGGSEPHVAKVAYAKLIREELSGTHGKERALRDSFYKTRFGSSESGSRACGMKRRRAERLHEADGPDDDVKCSHDDCPQPTAYFELGDKDKENRARLDDWTMLQCSGCDFHTHLIHLGADLRAPARKTAEDAIKDDADWHCKTCGPPRPRSRL